MCSSKDTLGRVLYGFWVLIFPIEVGAQKLRNFLWDLFFLGPTAISNVRFVLFLGAPKFKVLYLFNTFIRIVKSVTEDLPRNYLQVSFNTALTKCRYWLIILLMLGMHGCNCRRMRLDTLLVLALVDLQVLIKQKTLKYSPLWNNLFSLCELKLHFFEVHIGLSSFEV